MTILALFGFTIRQILGQRKLWLAVALLLLPAAIVVLIRAVAGAEATADVWEPYHVLMRTLNMVLLPLVCLLYGNGLIGAEIEQRTLVYLTTRRLHRATVLLVRFAATWAVLAVLCELALLTLHLSATWGAGALAVPGTGEVWQPWPDLQCYALVVLVGVGGYLAAFVAISLLFSRSLIVSVVYFVLVELVLGNIPVSASALTINHQLAKTVVSGIPETRRLVHWPKDVVDLLFPPGESGTTTVLIAIAVLLALASLLVTSRELVPARVSRD